MTTRARCQFVTNLAKKNRAFYSTDRGRSTLIRLDLSFEHRWTYLFELVQNAIDAGARSIRISVSESGDGLVVEHDGDAELREQNVRSLSEIFRSTKGAASVGFMGIGFKSVFGRFRGVAVSGWGWRFRFEMAESVGEEFGDRQPDLVGAVTPIWDEAIEQPSPGFTTRFELTGKREPSVDLHGDIRRLVSEADKTPLAILAWAGLTRIALPESDWTLSIAAEGGVVVAAAQCADERSRWLLLPVPYQPGREAIARFLEHRRIQPAEAEREAVYAAAGGKRTVLGVLPIGESGEPAPPNRGRVYATLPTEVALPFGIHIHADWLLNISRTGLRDIEENAWQREIVDRIADVLLAYLRWVANHFAEPNDVRVAFSALHPVGEARNGALGGMLASTGWRERVRRVLGRESVFPAWRGEDDQTTFVAAEGACHPPEALATLFAEEKGIKPGLLLSRPVLAGQLIGEGGLRFLIETGLAHEMTPEELEETWKGGLQAWWRAISPEPNKKRDLMLRLWSAVAELQDVDGWDAASLHCVRTVRGKWVAAKEALYLSEPPPSDKEPGGSKLRCLLEERLEEAADRIPDNWLLALRSLPGRSPYSSQARQRAECALRWVEERFRKLDLADALRGVISSLSLDAEATRDAILFLGFWARHRQRPALVTRVVATSGDAHQIVATRDALLAEPYVAACEARYALFPSCPRVAASYVELDPKKGDAAAWRQFLEKAGTLGQVNVQEIQTPISKWENGRAAEFLGIDSAKVPLANERGYTLVDFDIRPPLPSRDSSETLRRAIAPWIEEGHMALRKTGLRLARSYYYSSRQGVGTRPSRWRTALESIEWVPCYDGRLRRPASVLPAGDAARPDAPAARLSHQLLEVLSEEGIRFGSEIAEAPAIRRLEAIGSTLDATSLTALLGEARAAARTEEEKGHFQRALSALTIPTQDGTRVPIDRIVLRTGPNHRSGLGGWVVDLSNLMPQLAEELNVSGCPLTQTTTGTQALAYLKTVWAKAGRGEAGLAERVRQILPLAYSYCLEDRQDNPALNDEWDRARAQAYVFADREWRSVSSESPPLFDDIADRRWLPRNLDLAMATSGHLGRDREEQIAAARELGLPMLSSRIHPNWTLEGDIGPPEWAERFFVALAALRSARRPPSSEAQAEDATSGEEVRLRRVEVLRLTIRAEDREEDVPVNARLRDAELVVSGEPDDFSADAASELLSFFTLGQQAHLATALTQLIASIADERRFCRSLMKFARSHSPEFEIPDRYGIEEGTVTPPTPDEDQGGPSDPEVRRTRPGGSAVSGERREDAGGRGSFTAERRKQQVKVAEQKLKEALHGELQEPGTDGEAVDEPTEDRKDRLGDEEYRTVVIAYERGKGREPVEGHPLQEGWDISSTDSNTGERRLIEVKGRSHAWTEDQIVELSRAKIKTAFGAKEGDNTTWWLYVIEKTSSGYKVLPIRNPAEVAAGWILRGAGWRAMAEEEADVPALDSA